jgi:hypothetical protein
MQKESLYDAGCGGPEVSWSRYSDTVPCRRSAAWTSEAFIRPQYPPIIDLHV